MRRLLLAAALCTAGLAVGCRNGEDADHAAVRAAAEEYMQMLMKGKYDDFVAGIVYSDSMTADYQTQMTGLITEHAATLAAAHGGLVSVSAVADTLVGRHAQVFLEVMFADSTIESIDLPMVREGREWRMQ